MADRSSPEVRTPAVRVVFEHQGSDETQAGGIAAIAPKIGCIRQALRERVKRAGKDSGVRDGVTAGEWVRIKSLERENPDLRQANEILRKGEPVKAPLVQVHWRRHILRRRTSTAH